MYSAFYQDKAHNDKLSSGQCCSDTEDGTANDDFGLCTGISISAPQVAGMLQ